MTAELCTAVQSFADTDAEAAYRAQLARESYAAGYSDGHDAGAAAMAVAYKSVLTGVYRAGETEQRRRHVCCRPCRLRGHRKGCKRCEDRDRETFGNPHPDDFTGRST